MAGSRVLVHQLDFLAVIGIKPGLSQRELQYATVEIREVSPEGLHQPIAAGDVNHDIVIDLNAERVDQQGDAVRKGLRIQ